MTGNSKTQYRKSIPYRYSNNLGGASLKWWVIIGGGA